ncbi:hypothetical protein ABPG74_018930 [Tetrahymena malaccensis]
MRLSVFVLLALIAIAVAQTQEPSNDIDIDALVEDCTKKIGYPCKNGTNEENKACSSYLPTTEECISKCQDDNKNQLQDILGCYRSKCQSENTDVQTYFGKLYTCLSGISILAFTLSVSALALLL